MSMNPQLAALIGAFGIAEAFAQTPGFYLSFPRANPLGYQYEPWHGCFQAAPADWPDHKHVASQ